MLWVLTVVFLGCSSPNGLDVDCRAGSHNRVELYYRGIEECADAAAAFTKLHPRQIVGVSCLKAAPAHPRKD